MTITSGRVSTSTDAASTEQGSFLPPLNSPDCWEDSDRVSLRCRMVSETTHDIKTFVFEPLDRRVFTFEPGQFLTLLLEIDGRPVSRCYTISSPPTRPHRLSITVKRVPGGLVSNWLHDNLRPGDVVEVAAPGGAFTLTGRTAGKYLFLSAGSGITPLMSMTRTLYDLGSDADIVFVHSARSPVDIVFRGELAAMEAVMPGIRVTHVCESDYPSEPWTGLRGRLSADMLTAVVSDLHERATFTCGPAPYMDSVRRILGELGYDMAGYHEESFSFDLATPPAEVLADAVIDPTVDEPPAGAAAAGYSVEFVKSGRTIVCRPDQHVLEAALTAGVRLSSACGQGMCGTCKVSLLSGDVDMVHNGGIRPREITNGKILICCSKPLGDLRIDH